MFCLLLISNLIFCEISILNLQILIWWLSTWSILVTIYLHLTRMYFKEPFLCFVNYLPLYVCFLCASLFVLLVFPLSFEFLFFCSVFLRWKISLHIFRHSYVLKCIHIYKFPFPLQHPQILICAYIIGKNIYFLIVVSILTHVI